MNSIFFLYNEILYRPLLNGLVWFYTVLPLQDLGLAIVALTAVIRILLAPFLWKAQKTQKEIVDFLGRASNVDRAVSTVFVPSEKYTQITWGFDYNPDDLIYSIKVEDTPTDDESLISAYFNR